MLLLVQSRGIVSPEELTELQGRGGLVAQLYGQPETAKIETGLMGHHSDVCETQAANPGGLHSLSRGYSCEGPTDGAHCASVGKQLGPTADRHVSGGFRLSGQRSRVAWLGVERRFGWRPLGWVGEFPDGTRTTVRPWVAF